MLGLLLLSAAGKPLYTATEVVSSPVKASVNDRGLVAGIRTTEAGTKEAFVWEKGRVLWSSPDYTMAAGPNERGQVALGNERGLFLWEEGSVRPCRDVLATGPSPIKTPSEILGIGPDGRIVAIAYGFESTYSVIVWPRPEIAKGGFAYRNPLSVPFQPRAFWGDRVVAGTRLWPFRLPDSEAPKAVCFVRIADRTLPVGDASVRPIPTAVSERGEVVGYLDGPPREPFCWWSGRLTILPLPASTPPIRSTGSAEGVNAHGEIVGTATWQTTRVDGLSTTHELFQRACLWRDGRFVDLSTRARSEDGWTPSEGWGIDAHGDVLAVGSRSGGASPTMLLLLSSSSR